MTKLFKTAIIMALSIPFFASAMDLEIDPYDDITFSTDTTSELATLDWHELSFTPQEKFCFNENIMAAIKLFNKENSSLRKVCPELYDLSQKIVSQAQKAHSTFKENDNRPWYEKLEDYNILSHKATPPVIPLFQWVSEYAQGEAKVKNGYWPEVKGGIYAPLPKVTMSSPAEESLKKYSSEIEILLNQISPVSLNRYGEYGLNYLIFGRWHAFSRYDDYCNSDRVGNSSPPPYEIYMREGNFGFLSSADIIKIPHISEEEFRRFSHPAFIKLFDDCKKKNHPLSLKGANESGVSRSRRGDF